MTADITVLQQTYNGQLKELCRVTGNDCGGTSVNGRLYKIVEEIIGRNVTTESNRFWLDMLRIERITTSNTKVIRFKYPCSLNEICEELHGKDLNSVIQSLSYVNEITQVSDKFRFKADLIIKLVTLV